MTSIDATVNTSVTMLAGNDVLMRSTGVGHRHAKELHCDHVV